MSDYVLALKDGRQKLFDSKENTTNKRSLKKMFMSGMKKRINSRVLLQNFIKRIA